jgi:hypothetical protein
VAVTTSALCTDPSKVEAEFETKRKNAARAFTWAALYGDCEED